MFMLFRWSPNVQVCFECLVSGKANSAFHKTSIRFYGADGTRKIKAESLDAGALTMSDNNLSSKCGSLSIQFKSTEPLTYQVTYSSAPDLIIDFEFVAQGGGFQVKDGKLPFDPQDPENGHVHSRFIPRADTKGMLFVDGKAFTANGHGALVGALQYKPSSAARWNFVNFHGTSQDASLLLYQASFVIHVVGWLANG